MLNPALHLAEHLFDAPSKSAVRDGFGAGIVEAARQDARVVALTADVEESVRLEAFRQEFPDRFFDVGVSEQNLATLASGMAAYGKLPFIAAYAVFSPGRNWEQIRTTIALNNVPVKIVGMHAGLLTGPDGATHQALEDIALMRTLPNMIVLSPCDAEEARKATLAAARCATPVYLRCTREKMPVITTSDTPFEIGKAHIVWKSDAPRAAICATGPTVANALIAAKQLEGEGIATTVINVHTIKPLDEETILCEAKAAGVVVTVEDHQITGGLGGAIAELLARTTPLPIEYVGVRDRFGQSGSSEELYRAYGLDAPAIIAAVRAVLGRVSRSTA